MGQDFIAFFNIFVQFNLKLDGPFLFFIQNCSNYSKLIFFVEFAGKHLCQSIYNIETYNFIEKETPTQVFLGEFCRISKSTFF